MKKEPNNEIEEINASLESLLEMTDRLDGPNVSMEYLDERTLIDTEVSFGMENQFLQTVRDGFSVAGRMSMALGKGFMKFLDTVHRMIDTTYLVELQHLRRQIKAIPAGEALVKKGRMERRALARALSVDGQVDLNLPGFAKGMIELTGRIGSDVIPRQAATSRLIAQKLEAHRSKGMDAFVSEVGELVKVIASSKAPMSLFNDTDFTTKWPGNRTIFRRIKPSRPRREPLDQSASVRKMVSALTDTIYGIRGKVEVNGQQPEGILPILTPLQCGELLDSAETLLREAVRLKNVAKNYTRDKVPSTLSLTISGFLGGVRRQWDDFWTAEGDGFDEFEGPGGSNMKRVGRAHRNPLGGATKGAVDLVPGLLSVSTEASKDSAKDEAEVRDHILQAVWVSRYTKLSLIDHQQTAKSAILLLVGVARTYLEYVEESLDYYS